ncbi:hypothetical protein K438DRAFT_1984487 [Mycena galopus ATCC 62051]|nr:hypothetical protein K438DRAFT_1984487 [Mycena galopus ATCC 62051]
MSFPQTFDAFVPSNTLDFLALSKIKPGYVSFETLNAVPLDAAAPATSAYAKKITPPAVFVDNVLLVSRGMNCDIKFSKDGTSLAVGPFDFELAKENAQ